MHDNIIMGGVYEGMGLSESIDGNRLSSALFSSAHYLPHCSPNTSSVDLLSFHNPCSLFDWLVFENICFHFVQVYVAYFLF